MKIIACSYTVAVLGTVRPGAKKICGAPTLGKKFGPNIIFCVLFTESLYNSKVWA